MRIPIPTVVTLAISVALTVWFVTTREMDFAQEPTPEQYVQISEQWELAKPRIRASKSDESERAKAKAEKTSQLATRHLKKNKDQYAKIVLSPTPTLAEHGILQDKGPEYLSGYAAHLESEGQPQHALLAWERVIDTTNPNDDQRKRAITSISRLKNSLPPWNSKPNAEISLTLHAGAAIANAQALENALKTTAASISNASGGVVHVDTKLSLAKQLNSQASSVPVAIWLSRPARSAEENRAETNPVSFMAKPNDESSLINELQSGVYEIVRKHLAAETGFSKLPKDTIRAQADELIHYHITRLMWREFVNSMKD